MLMEATMLDSQWYVGVLLAGTVLHLVVLYGVYRRQQTADNAAAADTTTSVSVENGVVECPDCGTANDADYRYCGGCATHLPRAGALTQQDTRQRGSLFG
ncbi:hypothetical protein DM826_03635 [Halonotius aquaticus]|uniref:DUF7577 domain-containing protein n=2 Tax=Halonotius aquaticus TaxID=2216978 RepID=A0A3A6Q4F0_9EURY|nr:hypothetical protein DM826_03635 [Halonotius aquaticus]